MGRYLTFYAGRLTVLNLLAQVGLFALASFSRNEDAVSTAGLALLYGVFALVLLLPLGVLFGLIHVDVLRATEARRGVQDIRALTRWSLATSVVVGVVPALILLRGAQNPGGAWMWTPALAFFLASVVTGYLFAHFWDRQEPQARATARIGPRAGAGVGAALGWTAGFYGPFVYRSLTGASGGQFTGLFEFLYTGPLGALIGAAVGSALTAVRSKASSGASAHRTPILTLVTGTVLLLALAVLRPAPDRSTARAARRPDLREVVPGYRPMNAEAVRTPLSFTLVSPGEPAKQSVWTRRRYGWRERQPDGASRRFLFAGGAIVAGDTGAVYQERTGTFAFVPQRGSRQLHVFFLRPGDAQGWRDGGAMRDVRWPGGPPDTRMEDKEKKL